MVDLVTSQSVYLENAIPLGLGLVLVTAGRFIAEQGIRRTGPLAQRKQTGKPAQIIAILGNWVRQRDTYNSSSQGYGT
jgi:hypothetical protein